MNKQGETLTFDSLSDLANWLDATPRLDGAGCTSEDDHRSNAWDLGIGYQGTIDIAKAGGYWKDGAAMVRDGMAQAAEMSKQGAAPVLEHSVCGFMPDVPAYLAGVPDNMLTVGEQGISAVSPIVTIGVPNASGDIAAQSIMNRGIAIVTLVDALETQQYRVEIHTSLGCTGGAGGVLCDASVIIKQASEPWNPNSMAFGMGHPALIRRLGFAVRERCEGSLECTANGSYGMGALMGDNTYTVALPWLTEDLSLKQALKMVQKLARKSGLNVTLLDNGVGS